MKTNETQREWKYISPEEVRYWLNLWEQEATAPKQATKQTK